MDLGSISPNISQTQTRGRTALHLVAPTSRIQEILGVCAKLKTHNKRSYSFLEDHPHQGFCPFFTMKTMAFCPSADEDDGLLLKTMAIGLLLTRWMELGFVASRTMGDRSTDLGFSRNGRLINGARLRARWKIDVASSRKRYASFPLAYRVFDLFFFIYFFCLRFSLCWWRDLALIGLGWFRMEFEIWDDRLGFRVV